MIWAICQFEKRIDYPVPIWLSLRLVLYVGYSRICEPSEIHQYTIRGIKAASRRINHLSEQHSNRFFFQYAAWTFNRCSWPHLRSKGRNDSRKPNFQWNDSSTSSIGSKAINIWIDSHCNIWCDCRGFEHSNCCFKCCFSSYADIVYSNCDYGPWEWNRTNVQFWAFTPYLCSISPQYNTINSAY